MARVLSEEVPEYDPLQDMLTNTGLSAISVVPLIGAPVVTFVQGIVAGRQQQRQAEFNALVADELGAAVAVIEGLTIESIVDSDEFAAIFTSVSAAAAESASAAKRRRLAASMRAFSDVLLDSSTRRIMVRLVGAVEDVDVIVLDFLHGPEQWMDQHREGWRKRRSSALGSKSKLSLLVILRDWVLQPSEGGNTRFPGVDYQSLAAASMANLAANGLISPTLQHSDVVPKVLFETRTGNLEPLGNFFFEFLRKTVFGIDDPYPFVFLDDLDDTVN